MRKHTVQFVLVAILTSAIACICVGCTPKAADMMPAVQAYAEAAKTSPMPGEMSDLVKEIKQIIQDQGVLDEWMANARAHGLNPGLKVTIGEEKYFKIGLDGFDGDIEARTTGTGTQLPTGVRQELVGILAKLEGRTDPEATALRDKIIQVLGWNRIESPHNPVP